MRIFAALRCLAALALLSVYMAIPGSCAHLDKVATNACAVSPELVKLVDQIIGSDDYDQKLDEVTTQLCALKDAVKQVAALTGQVIANKAATDATAAKKYDHATAWLAKFEAPVKAGLPGGGGGIHFCCFHPNGGGAWQAGERATNGTIVTGANMAALCNGGFLPDRQNCG